MDQRNAFLLQLIAACVKRNITNKDAVLLINNVIKNDRVAVSLNLAPLSVKNYWMHKRFLDTYIPFYADVREKREKNTESPLFVSMAAVLIELEQSNGENPLYEFDYGADRLIGTQVGEKDESGPGAG